MKKYLSLFLALMLVLVLTVGCGGSSSSSTSTDTTDESKESSMASDESTANSSGSDEEELLVGQWEATDVQLVKDTEDRGNIVLNLKDDGTFQEDIFRLDSEGNVVNTETPDIVYKGDYKTDQDKMTLEYTEVTEDGNVTTGDAITNKQAVYTFDVVDDTMDWTSEDGLIYNFVRVA